MLRFLLFFVIAGSVFSENILFITILPSRSHHIWNEALVQGLLSNGHNITLIGHDDAKIQSENYTVLKIKGIGKALEGVLNSIINPKHNVLQDLLLIWDYIATTARHDLQSGALKVLLDYPRNMFDLIVFDLGCGQYFYPLIEHFGNPPVVGLSPFGLSPYLADAMGNQFHSFYPIYVLPYTDNMTFIQRLENLILHLVEYFMKMYYMPSLYKMAQKRFGGNISDFHEVEKNVSILLTNNDPILDFPQPFPPHIIPVGGLHIQPAILSNNKELQEILDKAKNGVIYFSFGTNIQPSFLSAEKKQLLLNTFSRLKQIVLWKYDGEDLIDIPKNVIIRKWYQQNNILGHKNVQLFITHSGLLSTQEAMYHGVPVIGIPFIIDQRNNAAKFEAKKMGKKLHISTLTGDILYDTIQEVLNNPMYKDNMMRVSTKFRDQKETPLERAVFWIEYVLRHKDIRHLSPSSRYMTLWERHNVDIVLFIFTFIFACIAILIFTLKWITKTLMTLSRAPKFKKI